ncbi:outer dense fiber protein 3-like protein 2 [Scaptodrosophila lebanonensis]|uniref:Outer dense fiber protein 3-like protein 2 n=1 Tax=Drosophila lebanonensis TaxID=7225 RepID=A0A6J2U1M2_DROLE|nr:outer dense fiber protein 3-like protein 2 [Scaptodrosophila lebanonensis]
MVRSFGPGPGAYMLPSTIGFSRHDSSKQRSPQYSFGVRTATMVGSSSTKPRPGPGPAAYQVDKLTRYGGGSIVWGRKDA